ncbi:unnamed protein product [Diamesa hyperborea]
MELTEFLLYIVSPIIFLVYFLVEWKYSYFSNRNILHMKPTLLLGNLDGLGTKYHFSDKLKIIYDEFKGKDVIAGMYQSIAPSLIVTDLDLVRTITVKDFNSFTDRGVFYNEENEPITAHLFAIEGEKWKFLRNKLSPTFTSGKMKMMYNTIADKGDNLVEAINLFKGEASELKKLGMRFTVDVIGSCAFGIECGALKDENAEILMISKEIFNAKGFEQFYLFFLFAFQKISIKLKLRQFSHKVENYFSSVIKSQMAYREENKIKRNDFLDMLIQLKTKGTIDGEISSESRKFTVDEVIAQAFIFYFAGFETSSTALAFTIGELADHTEIQDRVRAEVLEKIEETNGEITYESLHEMKYLNQVVNESLRKHSPVFLLVRKANHDYQIPNSKHIIPKDMQVIIPTMAFQHDKEYFEKPDEFNPEHFNAEQISKRPNLAFLPFGEGPRNCIGMRFGLVQTKFAIATIVKNFLVLPEAQTQRPLKFDMKSPANENPGGIWVKYQNL